MSVYSMTGFASVQRPLTPETPDTARGAHAGTSLVFEIRSVNGRFLDLSVRMPDDWRHHEPLLRQRIGQRIRRGKVDVRVGYHQSGGAGSAETLSPKALQNLAMLQDQVRVWLPAAAPMSVADALRWCQGGTSVPPAISAELFASLCDAGLDAFVLARANEGARLAQLVQAVVAQLTDLVSTARPQVPQLVADMQRRFVARFHQAVHALAPAATAPTVEERALAEASSFALRVDVTEELDRLDAHLAEVLNVVRQGKDVGKRLDFLAQEMHREANTLGSKSASLELSRISLDMKILIEQMREQVQNIE